MKKHWIHSITTRLLLFAGLSVFISVVGISAFIGLKFYAQLQTEFRADTQRSATESANAIKSTVEFWLSSTSIAMHYLEKLPADERKKFAETFLGTNKEFVAFQVVPVTGGKSSKLFAMTTDIKDVRFQAEAPATLQKKIRIMNERVIQIAKKQDQDTVVLPFTNQLGLPLMAVGFKFIVNKNEETWAIVTTWQTRIQKSLSQSSSDFGVVLDGNKQFLFSPRADLNWDDFKDVLADASESGGVSTADSNGQVYVAGQAPVPRLDLHVAVIKNATTSMSRVKYIIANAASWTSVYILALLFFCYFAANGITSRLKRTIESTGRISQGNFDVQIEVKGKDEISDLGRAVNQMAVQIRGLLVSRIEAARQEKELETARLVQSTFFPKDQAESPMFSFVGHNIPASECGGDWWGRISFEDRYEYILIADATGHGAGAALVTAMAYAGCMTLNEFLARGVSEHGMMGPAEVLTTLNKVLWTAGKGTSSMTCFSAMVDTHTGRMVFANGGHCMPVIVSNAGTDKRDYLTAGKKKSVKTRMFSLISRGDPLGFAQEVSYEESEIVLEAGDKMLLYTDGFLENNNAAQVPLGKAKFNKLILGTVDQPGGEMVTALVKKYGDYIGQEAPIDDVTIVVAEVKHDWMQRKLSGAA